MAVSRFLDCLVLFVLLLIVESVGGKRHRDSHDSDEEDGNGGSSVGRAIGAIVVGCIVIGTVILIVVLCCVKRSKKKKRLVDQEPSTITVAAMDTLPAKSGVPSYSKYENNFEKTSGITPGNVPSSRGVTPIEMDLPPLYSPPPPYAETYEKGSGYM